MITSLTIYLQHVILEYNNDNILRIKTNKNWNKTADTNDRVGWRYKGERTTSTLIDGKTKVTSQNNCTIYFTLQYVTTTMTTGQQPLD